MKSFLEVGTKRAVKAQASMENLASFLSLLVLVVPLSLLFITLASINDQKSYERAFELSFSSLAEEIEKAYVLCSERGEPIVRKVSFTAPDGFEGFSYENGFLIATFERGSLLKELSIPRAEIVFGDLRGRRGNIFLEVSCSFQQAGNIYLLEVDPE